MTISGHTIRKVSDQDKDAVVVIINYFIEHSYANYMEGKVDGSFFDMARNMCRNGIFYVIDSPRDGVIGFGMLRPHMYPGLFKRAAEVSYFILPEHTHKGLGGELLATLEQEAQKVEIATLLANISSRNEQSIAFHRKQGFKDCGRFERIGSKFGKDFDVVWMQKFISS